MRPSIPRLLLVASLTYASAVLSGQFGTVVTSPPLNPYEPAVLGSPATAIDERLRTRQWRRRYNVYELTALIWQLYQVHREGLDWEGIFGLLRGAMAEEVDAHRAHYAGLRTGGGLVQHYAAVQTLVADAGVVHHYVGATIRLLGDAAVWTDAAEGDRIRTIGHRLRERALRTLETLPLVVDPAPGSPAGTATYWATPADRLAQLDRLTAEVRALRRDAERLYLQVGRVAAARRGAALAQPAGESLLLPPTH